MVGFRHIRGHTDGPRPRCMLSDLTDKRAVVTGAAQGLGRAVAELFIERGARVVLTDIDADMLKQTVAVTRRHRLTRCRATSRPNPRCRVHPGRLNYSVAWTSW